MKKIIMLGIMGIAVAGLAACARDDHEGHDGHGSAAVSSEAPAPGKEAETEYRKVTEEEIGKNAVCPVTGDKVRVSEETISMSYKGRNYYFCCAGCDKSFMKHPEKYAVKEEAAAKRYVCPMGDYEGDEPGRCPKCGMTLKEKK